jgi:hypothetical protein
MEINMEQTEEIGALAAMVFQQKNFLSLSKLEQQLCTILLENEYLFVAPYSGLTGKLTNKSKGILTLLGVKS